LITDELPVYSLYSSIQTIAFDKRLGNVRLGIWGILTPLDNVYWKQMP